MWKRILFSALALLAGKSSGLAYVSSVEVLPPRPGPADAVVVRAQGYLPDTCWKFLGHSVDRAGPKILIVASTSHDQIGGCLQILVDYSLEADLGRLDPGTYEVTVSDDQGSKTATFQVAGDGGGDLPPRFMRGDSNSDGGVDISDAITTLNALFSGGARLACEDAADANDDGGIDLSDAIFTLLNLFASGAAFPAPGPRACGFDPTADPLGCESFAPCAPGTTAVYRLSDNGLRCFSWPCYHWTAVDEAGAESRASDVDLSPLALSSEEKATLMAELAQGLWRVRGYSIPGPEGPAGLGTTLVVLEVAGPT